MKRRVVTYGQASANADFTASAIELGPLRASAVIKRRPSRSSDEASTPIVLGTLSLKVPGRHNLQNALAAVAVGLELGLSFERMASALAEFRGAERRFELKGEANDILVVDDYGHHPTEIEAVLAAARSLGRRIVVAFQPHRFTRTAMLADAFGPALAGADRIVLTDIYAAGEDPIPGITIDALADAIRRSVTVPVDVVPQLAEVPNAVARIARPGDLVLTLGAGSIGSVSDEILRILSGGVHA
jgi:UDP-N-acetylmuramate--alanine ligase